jgi:D-inositol-3-phosphate glycosyltransferase
VRILLVSSYFLPHVGGVERFVAVLAEGLADRGHEVTVLCCRTQRSPREENVGRFRIVRVPAANGAERRFGTPLPLPSPLAFSRAASRLVRSADVVHAQDALYPTTWVALAAARRHHVPSIVTQHVGFVRQQHVALDLIEKAAIRAVGPIIRRADRVVSYNPAVASWAARAWSLGSVDVLPSGVSIASAVARRRDVGLADDRFVALFVGRDVAKKGLRHFISAAGPEYDLVAVTDSAHASEGVEVRPFMPPEQLGRLLRAVDALVLPSVDEGVPLVIQEAACAGIPIVTTAQPGLEAYFADDDALFVEASGESIRAALLRLASDPALCRRLGERASVVGHRHFGASEFVDAYENAYARLAAG